MTPQDNDCQDVIQACLSADLQHRLNAYEAMLTYRCLEMEQVPFLLERLNAATLEREKAAILKLLFQLAEPLPEEVMETLLERLGMLEPSLLSKVVNAMALTQTEEMLTLLYCLLEGYLESEDPDGWQEAIPSEVLFALLAHPEMEVCIGALDVLEQLPPHCIPVEIIHPYCSHEQAFVREAALKTLWVAERRVPSEPFLAALRDPEPRIRAIASHACMFLVKWCGELFPLEPLVEALHDEFPPVREDLLDALGNAPERAPVDPVVVALSDSCYYVRCAAVETLGLMSPRAPLLAYPIVRSMAESDPDPRVRERATATLLRFSKFTRKSRRRRTIPIVSF